MKKSRTTTSYRTGYPGWAPRRSSGPDKGPAAPRLPAPLGPVGPMAPRMHIIRRPENAIARPEKIKTTDELLSQLVHRIAYVPSDALYLRLSAALLSIRPPQRTSLMCFILDHFRKMDDPQQAEADCIEMLDDLHTIRQLKAGWPYYLPPEQSH